jgi:hypothetical protein
LSCPAEFDSLVEDLPLSQFFSLDNMCQCHCVGRV